VFSAIRGQQKHGSSEELKTIFDLLGGQNFHWCQQLFCLRIRWTSIAWFKTT